VPDLTDRPYRRRAPHGGRRHCRHLPYARSHNIPLAIEPLHPMDAADRACVNTLAQALDFCEALGDGVGVAIDTYHVWWDSDLAAQISRAGAAIAY
jgi:sugar phosphate isomerase/epimerase